MTLIAGLSVTIFLALTQWLVGLLGWRGAVVILGLVLLTTVGSLAVLVVRDRPSGEAGERGLDPKGAHAEMLRSFNHTDRNFWLASAAFFLGLAATFAMLVHQVAYLRSMRCSP